MLCCLKNTQSLKSDDAYPKAIIMPFVRHNFYKNPGRMINSYYFLKSLPFEPLEIRVAVRGQKVLYNVFYAILEGRSTTEHPPRKFEYKKGHVFFIIVTDPLFLDQHTGLNLSLCIITFWVHVHLRKPRVMCIYFRQEWAAMVDGRDCFFCFLFPIFSAHDMPIRLIT